MKKLISVFITLIIIASCVSFSVSAVDTTIPGTFFTEEQVNKAQKIKDKYDINAIYLYYDQTPEETGNLRDLCKEYLNRNNITGKYFVMAMNREYYDYIWSDDLDGIFHSIDGDYIFDSISSDESGNPLSQSEMEDKYYDLLSKMLENRTNCPYKYIKDQAGVLTDGEEKALNDTLIEFQKKNNLDLVVVLTNGIDVGIYDDDRMDFADDYYDYNGYAEDGALLLVNIGAFDVYTRGNSWISTSGSCIDYITDDDISDIGAELTPMLVDGLFFDAVNTFPDLVSETVNVNKFTNYTMLGVVIAVVCVICAFIYTGKLKRQLKSVYEADDANDYIVNNSLNVTRGYDHYLYSHITKTERSSKSGSSSHTSSSGSSHGGGGF